MKRMLSLLLALTLLLPLSLLRTEAAVGYALPAQLDGCENIFLSYTFNCNDWSSGRRTKEGYRPLVGYYNNNGVLSDTFFDTFLFLPCVTTTPSGGKTYRDNANPANFSDWQLFIDDVFLDGYNVDALNEAVGEMKAGLGSEYSGYKARIFLTCMYPVKTQTRFGDVDGDGITENFTNLDDRLAAIEWMVDEQLERFMAGNYEHLELVGFYWFEEDFAESDPHESELVKHFNGYVHSAGLKTIWIPYNGAPGYDRWAEFGFNVACYQPNYMFNASTTESLLTYTCRTANELGMCVEIEAAGTMLRSAEYYNRYMDYLRICTEQGAGNAIKMYYNEAVDGVFYNAYRSSDPAIRRIYDLTYKYAKGLLQNGDCQYYPVRRPAEDYEIVSLGKPYTASAPYTDSELDYADVSGLELTDGVFGSTQYGTEWHPFHRWQAESDGSFRIDLDLGAVYDDLRYFALELNSDEGAGIGLPASVEYFVSADGTSYTSVGKVNSYGDFSLVNPTAELVLHEDAAGRYVRVRIVPGTYNFVFASELSVGVLPESRYDEDTYSNVALDKPYTALAYTDSDFDYADYSGLELTDGIYGGDDALSTHWHAFHISQLTDGYFEVVIDLGEVMTNLSRFAMEFCLANEYSISLPPLVTYSVSSDGLNYVTAGSVSLWQVDGILYEALLDTDALTGRYIRAVIEPGWGHYVFASEFYIGRTETALPSLLSTVDGSALTLDAESRICTLPLGMTAQAVEQQFTQDVTLLDENGFTMAPNELVGTGCTVEYRRYGDVLCSYAFAAAGDINGDGSLTAADYLLAKRTVLGLVEKDALHIAAGDLNNDGKWTASDYLLLKRIVLKL